MHPRVLSQRSDAAHLRILEAATTLTERAGLPAAREALVAARDRDPQVSRMQEREAVADLLEALVAARRPEPMPQNPPPLKRGPGRPPKAKAGR